MSLIKAKTKEGHYNYSSSLQTYLVAELKTRYTSHHDEAMRIQKKIRDLTQDLEKYELWIQRCLEEARELDVDLH